MGCNHSQELFFVFFQGFFANSLDFCQICFIVRQADHDLDQHPLMQYLKRGNAVFPGLAGPPLLELPEQFRMFDV